jgi:hypothetical protein
VQRKQNKQTDCSVTYLITVDTKYSTLILLLEVSSHYQSINHPHIFNFYLCISGFRYPAVHCACFHNRKNSELKGRRNRRSYNSKMSINQFQPLFGLSTLYYRYRNFHQLYYYIVKTFTKHCITYKTTKVQA